MAGNVYEWCSDWYDENYYRKAPYRNPKCIIVGKWRVIRWGAWDRSDWYQDSCVRSDMNPTNTSVRTGFRCAMDLPVKKKE